MSDFEKPTLYRTVPITVSDNTMTQEIKPLSEEEIINVEAHLVDDKCFVNRKYSLGLIPTIRKLQEENREQRDLIDHMKKAFKNIDDKKDQKVEKLKKALSVIEEHCGPAGLNEAAEIAREALK